MNTTNSPRPQQSSSPPTTNTTTNTTSPTTPKTAQPANTNKPQVSFMTQTPVSNVPLSAYSKGMIVQAKYSGDGKYYRARIDDIQGNQFLVLYLDFSGSQEWVHVSGVKLVV